MRNYFSLFKSKKIVLPILAIFLLTTGLSFIFHDSINKSFSGLKTWLNTSSTYIAYDARKFEENCYVYYGKNLVFNVEENKESIKLPSHAYQFIDSVQYDNRSILNKQNVISGEYKELTDGEIAVPKSISNHYKKRVGDSFYLNGTKEYKIKYITSDFYSINDASINDKESVIFVGSSSVELGTKDSYAVFNNVSREYNKVYSFVKIQDGFRLSFILELASLSLIIFGELIFSILFYKKDKMNTLNDTSLSGNKKMMICDLLAINAITLILPFIISAIVFLVLNNYWIAIVSGGLSILLFGIDSLITRLKVK